MTDDSPVDGPAVTAEHLLHDPPATDDHRALIAWFCR